METNDLPAEPDFNALSYLNYLVRWAHIGADKADDASDNAEERHKRIERVASGIKRSLG